MALDDLLNARQVEVLRWISDGCTDGRWPDFTYKTTANALQGRRLVEVSKRGGTWSATISAAGQYYLTHGRYPSGHWAKKRSVRAVDLDRSVAASVQSPPTSWRPPPPRPPKSPPPDGLTPTRKLLKDIIDAGGFLEIDTREDDTSYRSLVGIINRRKMAPDGQEVIMVSDITYHHVIFRLSDVSDWKTGPPSQTVAAERIGKWHPAVATLRDEKRLDSMDKALRGRAFRLLHALAREAEARGHSVRIPKRRINGYVQDSSRLDGHLIFTVEDIDCSVSFWQPNDQLPHKPTKEELERAKKWEWWSPPRYDHVPADRLSMSIDTSSRWSSKITWAEKKGPRLESRLPDVLTTFERWAVVHAERNEAERRAEIAKRERQEREDAIAREAYVEHVRGQRLVADLEAWEQSRRLDVYLSEMARHIKQLADAEDRTAAEEWLAWCRHDVAKRDPLNGPIRMPAVKPPGYNELQEFRKRLGFSAGLW